MTLDSYLPYNVKPSVNQWIQWCLSTIPSFCKLLLKYIEPIVIFFIKVTVMTSISLLVEWGELKTNYNG